MFKYIVIILMSIIQINHAYAQVNSKSISYFDAGSGQPIILIHAFPTDKDLWLPQQTGLQQHFRIIGLDLYGFGQASEADGSAITMAQYADEVRQLMDELHIQKAIIGGESMGGYIALAFLQAYPDRVSGLILSDTQSIADSEEDKAKREASAQDILKNGTAGVIKGFMMKALSTHASEQTRASLKSMMDRQPAAAMASAIRGMALREDLSQVLAATKIPVLIITGSDDVVISPKQSEVMSKLALNSKLVVIANAGHLSNLESPEIWNKAVMDFF